jgi:hypothetical protein
MLLVCAQEESHWGLLHHNYYMLCSAGVHNAAAAGELALAGELAAVEELVSTAGNRQPCSSTVAPQQLQHLVDEQPQQPAGHVLQPLEAAATHNAVQLHNGWADLQCSSSCADAVQLQQQELQQFPLPLLPRKLDDHHHQQQQQQQQQQQELQHHSKRLTSSSKALPGSITSSAGQLYSSSNSQQHSISSAVGSIASRGSGSSSNGRSHYVAAGAGTHVQQQHGAQLLRPLAGSSGGSSSSSSSSSSLPAGLQLVRPAEGPAVAGGEHGCCTQASASAVCLLRKQFQQLQLCAHDVRILLVHEQPSVLASFAVCPWFSAVRQALA